MKKYILRSVRQSPFGYVMFVVSLKYLYYFTSNPDDATRFETIGEAMEKSVIIKERNNMLFQVVPVEEC